MWLQCYSRLELYRQVKLDHVQVDLKIDWVQDQIGCYHFVPKIWRFLELFLSVWDTVKYESRPALLVYCKLRLDFLNHSALKQ